MIIGLCQLPLLWRYRYWSRSHDILLSYWELGIWKKIRKFPRFQRFQLLKEEVPLRKWLREFEYQASFIIPLKKSFREKWWHRPFLKTCMQVRRNGIHAERLEWNTCHEPERRLWHWLSECAGDKSQSKCKEEALRCLSSLDIKSFRSAKEKEKV